MIASFWESLESVLEDLGGITIFLLRVIKITFITPSSLSRISEQVVYVTIRSLPTVLFSGIFVGAILVLQFNQILVQYDAQSLLGGLNTSSVVREVGPLIISFLLAGKIGAFTAAELGTMRVTEQIDAIECLGTEPMGYLIVPRFMGIVVSTVLLLILGIMISILGSLTISALTCGINPLQYLHSVPKFIGPFTLFGGIFKSIVYGTIVANVSCYYGYTCSGGARGVGKAVTQAAVYTNFYIVIANLLTSEILEFLHHAYQALTGGNL